MNHFCQKESIEKSGRKQSMQDGKDSKREENLYLKSLVCDQESYLGWEGVMQKLNLVANAIKHNKIA